MFRSRAVRLSSILPKFAQPLLLNSHFVLEMSQLKWHGQSEHSFGHPFRREYHGRSTAKIALMQRFRPCGERSHCSSLTAQQNVRTTSGRHSCTQLYVYPLRTSVLQCVAPGVPMLARGAPPSRSALIETTMVRSGTYNHEQTSVFRRGGGASLI